MKKMHKAGNITHHFATIVSSLLCAVLFVCANTTSSTMIHQPAPPKNLDRFRKV